MRLFLRVTQRHFSPEKGTLYKSFVIFKRKTQGKKIYVRGGNLKIYNLYFLQHMKIIQR